MESYESMMQREKWCNNCKHPDGFHHLCKGKTKGCKCSVCKSSYFETKSGELVK